MVAGEVAAMLVFHVYGIKIAYTEEVTEVAVSALNQRFPTKDLEKVEWHMGSEDKRTERKVLWRFHKPSSFGALSLVLTGRRPAPSPPLLPWTSGT